ncbi:uncharacterized protein LOC120635029 [Pararge aegeria]|uniref:uncharacterized protein LOC120635029 n=1 Tax=Pararge aegeria TaxID=116150 RepID=UPI0019D2F9C4|nr:uncharacterized protein LOC120635029 [Pararge aegeria]
MDVISCDVGPRGLCGWQEIFTDFDSWLCKFSRHLNQKRSSRVIKSVELIIEDSPIKTVSNKAIADEEKEKKMGSLTLQHLLVEGFSIEKCTISNDRSKMHIMKDLGHFLNIFQDGDEFMDYNYLLVRLLSGGKKYFYQYTRSKLLFVNQNFRDPVVLYFGRRERSETNSPSRKIPCLQQAS